MTPFPASIAPPVARTPDLVSAALAGSPVAMVALVERYQESQRPIGEAGIVAEARSANTMRTYGERIRAMMAWGAERGLRLDAWTSDDLRAYGVALFRAGRKTATVKLSMTVAGIVFHALQWGGVAMTAPVRPKLAKDPIPKHEKRVPPPWDELSAHLAALREAALHGEDRAQIRLAVCVHLMGKSALRRGEVVGLRWSDVDDSRRVVRVCGKGSKIRTVPVNPFTLALLQRLRLVMQPQGWDAVISRLDHPGALRGDTLHRIVSEWERSIGLVLPAPCHILRHAALTQMASNGEPLTRLRDLAGHETISTTEIYVSRASEADKRAAIDRIA